MTQSIYRNLIIVSFFLMLATSIQAQQIQVTHFQQHSVENGETAASISAKYHINFRDFLLLNDFPETIKLKPGTIVLIREIKEGEVSSTDTTEEGLTLSGFKPSAPVINLAPEPVPVAKKTKESKSVARKNTHDYSISSDDDIVYGPHGTVYHISHNGYHVVEKNQTCYRIALIYGLNLDYLLELNHLSSYIIPIGRKLKVRK